MAESGKKLRWGKAFISVGMIWDRVVSTRYKKIKREGKSDSEIESEDEGMF